MLRLQVFLNLDSAKLKIIWSFDSGRIHRTIGPYGGGGGSAWNEKVFTKIRAFGINHQELIYSIQIQYEKDGKLTWSTMHGTDGGSRSEVTLKTSYESPVVKFVCLNQIEILSNL